MDTIFDGGMTPRQCGEEGAENVVWKMGQIAKSTTGNLSRFGKTAEEARLEYHKNMAQQLLFQSAVATSVAPPSLGLLADQKRSAKRLKQQLLPPFGAISLPSHSVMTGIDILNVVTEDDVAGAVAAFGTKHTNSSSAAVEILKIKFNNFTVESVTNSNPKKFTAGIPASRSYVTFKLGEGRGFKIPSCDIIDMKAEGNNEMHIRVAAPVRQISKNSPGLVPQSCAGGESALEVASVLKFTGGDDVVALFTSFAAYNDIEVVDVISNDDNLTVEGIRRHESAKIAKSAVGSNMPLHTMGKDEVKDVLKEAAAIEDGFYGGTSTPSTICCFCKKRVLYRCFGTDRVLPVLQDSPNTRYTFCESVNLFEAGALAELEI